VTWIVEQLTLSPLRARLTRYTIGSIVAAATSAVTFALVFALGASTTASSIIAFVAGAIPNWVLNRRWAWKVRGRINFGREVVAYIAISLLSLLASSAATAWTQHHAGAVSSAPWVHVALVTGAYLAVFALLFAAKFAVYEAWVFSGRSRVRAALRSRMNVWSAARANRMP
jgi:putative flippase GtrA